MQRQWQIVPQKKFYSCIKWKALTQWIYLYIFLQYISHNLQDYSYMQMLNYTDYIHRVYLQYMISMHLKSKVKYNALPHWLHSKHFSPICVISWLEDDYDLWKGFTTLITLTRFLFSMGSFMFSKITMTNTLAQWLH